MAAEDSTGVMCGVTHRGESRAPRSPAQLSRLPGLRARGSRPAQLSCPNREALVPLCGHQLEQQNPASPAGRAESFGPPEFRLYRPAGHPPGRAALTPRRQQHTTASCPSRRPLNGRLVAPPRAAPPPFRRSLAPCPPYHPAAAALSPVGRDTSACPPRPLASGRPAPGVGSGGTAVGARHDPRDPVPPGTGRSRAEESGAQPSLAPPHAGALLPRMQHLLGRRRSLRAPPPRAALGRRRGGGAPAAGPPRAVPAGASPAAAA
ncbi:translation initiation factor IF-2-like [Indicator indicator]|uniref:translation initiation factor IF-2-like n=1 Tax=Indicator indicator TaxID=1002788 RepID=UPI0023E038E4|nr:translation initiation factor IF-2-like [Indicator indicator]